MWRAQGSRGSAFLFGQMPVRSDTPWQTAEVMAAFNASGTLWVENPVFSREEAEALSHQSVDHPQLSTAEFLPEDDLERLHSQLSRAGLPTSAFDQLPADDLYQQMSAVMDAKSSADFSRLPERVLRERATAADMAIVTEWRSLAEVANFIPKAPHPIKLQLIRMGLDQYDIAGLIEERLQAWVSGDAQYFERLGAITAHRYPELFAKMSGERNQRLAERLAVALETPGEHFVCVGICHVTGPDSVQS
jgi:uncharacterized protein YbaP (TraB family)